MGKQSQNWPWLLITSWTAMLVAVFVALLFVTVRSNCASQPSSQNEVWGTSALSSARSTTTGVLVGVGVLVDVAVLVAVDVLVAVAVLVGVGVAVLVAVLVAVGVAVAVGVDVAVDVLV